jgi:hypothetical protein
MAPTGFGLRPSSGSLQLSLPKGILILKHSVRLHRNLLCGGVAACRSMACVLCVVQSETSSRSAQHTVHTPFRDMLPHHRITNNDVTLLNVLISI